jgi:hypothetical protein
MKQIPLVGEFVLIYKTFNQQATTDRWREGWYYVASIDIQSSINHNMLPGLSDGARQEDIDETKRNLEKHLFKKQYHHYNRMKAIFY